MAEDGWNSQQERPRAGAPPVVPDDAAARAYGPGAAADARAPGDAPVAPDHRAADRHADAAAGFEIVAIPCLPDVARFARSLTHDEAEADDLVQETYLRAFSAWHTFVPGSDCRPWLFTICRRLFVRARDRERRVVAVGDDADAETFAAVRLHIHARAIGVEDLFTRLDVAPALGRALAGLSEGFRTVVQLVDVEGLAYEEAAAVLDVPVGTVRSRLFRGRRLLQEQLVLYAEDLGITRDRSAAPSPPPSSRPEP